MLRSSPWTFAFIGFKNWIMCSIGNLGLQCILILWRHESMELNDLKDSKSIDLELFV